MGKQIRYKRARKNEIRASIGKIDGDYDFVISRDNCPKCDSALLFQVMANERYSFNGYPDTNKSLIEELLDRGYDISTLEFSCKKLDETDEDAVAFNRMYKTRYRA